MDIIMYVGISQCLFAAIIMLTKKEGDTPDKLLTAWLFLMAIEFSTCAVDYFYFDNPLLSSVFLLINPAFYLYIKSLTTRDFKPKYIHLLHLAPYLVFEITTYLIREPFSIQILYPDYPHFWFSLSFSIANLVSWMVYNILSIWLVHRHRRNLENEYSYIDRYTSIAWLLVVLIFYTLYCSFALITGILALKINDLINLPSILNYSMLLALSYMLGFYGLKQRPLFIRKKQSTTQPEIILPEKYKSSILTQRDKEDIRKTILLHFETQKPYLNPEFNMTYLSESLLIPKHHVTEVLNTLIGMNFFRFVNAYRIEAVKEMLAQKSLPYSIEAIGYECGFNSKSSFFTVFKAITGLTPLQYKNRLG